MLKNHNLLTTDNIQKIEAVMPFGCLSYVESIDSTNSWLLEHGNCGDICISEIQISGRGRRGRPWVSPNGGNLYFSICYCVEKIEKHWSLLGLVVGLAITEALKELGLTNHGIKWPNDIFWHEKKLGGILIEAVNQTGKVVIGIGLNINMPVDEGAKIDQPFTSISDAMKGKQFSRVDFIKLLIQHLYRQFNFFSSTYSFEDFVIHWNRWDILQGEQVVFTHQDKQVNGTVSGIDHYGRIGILLESGEVAYFSSLDIKLKKLGKNENTAN